MRKIFLALLLIGFSFALGYTFFQVNPNNRQIIEKPSFSESKKSMLRFALVADSHSDNQNLEKALMQAQGFGINFVIGLGDWSTVGTQEELEAAKKVFEQAKIPYFVTSGDHDLWDSRNRGKEEIVNFKTVFKNPNKELEENDIQIVIVDNSDIYKGILPNSWQFLVDSLKKTPKLRFVMAHKTPFHPDSKHVMGEDNGDVAKQAQSFLQLLVQNKVDGFFSGDLHFFAQFKDPTETVKITTVGAVTREKNFQGPRFAIVTVFDDYSWKVEDIEIR